jgi:hypothetical protein
MIVSITGSREITKYALVAEAVKKSGFVITKIISGGARGVDTLAEVYANVNEIEFQEYPANWKLYKKRAGHLRNIEMADIAEAAIIIWNGKSTGTADYIELIDARDKPKHLRIVENKGKRK